MDDALEPPQEASVDTTSASAFFFFLSILNRIKHANYEAKNLIRHHRGTLLANCGVGLHAAAALLSLTSLATSTQPRAEVN